MVARLDSSYVFLRNLEHRLQYLDDQQTQELPENPEQQAIIAEGNELLPTLTHCSPNWLR